VIHYKCLIQYIKSNNIKCPICKKSIFDPKLYEKYVDKFFSEVEIPDDLKDKQMEIFCNDCLKNSTVKYHIYGGKCLNCRSYNTSKCKD
jgi:RING finger and CHY zinc finger domain-containing protein 1